MPKVEMDVETTVAPERVRAALLDFSSQRPAIWPGITPSLYEVYEVGETTADIKEGTRTVWAKEHYDWSDPDTVKWTVVESNFCAPGSYVQATVRPREGGGSRIHIEWNRTPTSLQGRVATVLIKSTNGKPVAASFKRAMAKLERASSPPA
jgi:hypothetical protein